VADEHRRARLRRDRPQRGLRRSCSEVRGFSALVQLTPFCCRRMMTLRPFYSISDLADGYIG
jgi:hypothetical protein